MICICCYNLHNHDTNDKTFREVNDIPLERKFQRLSHLKSRRDQTYILLILLWMVNELIFVGSK